MGTIIAKLMEWTAKALTNKAESPSRERGEEPIPFDQRRYARNFTEEDHARARAKGYRDAWEMDEWEVGGKLADEGAQRRKH